MPQAPQAPRPPRSPQPPRRRGGAGRENEQYVSAFARVRLVRAWIGTITALVAMLYGYVALLERLLRAP